MPLKLPAAIAAGALVASLVVVWASPVQADSGEVVASDVVVAIRGTDNAVWVRVDEGDSTSDHEFSAWENLGGLTNLSPSVSRDNLLTIRGIDGATWYRQRDDATNTWTPWASLGGLTNDTPVADRYGDVYIRGIDGAVWFRYFEETYRPWRSLLGSIVGAPVVAPEGLLAVRGVDNGVYFNRPSGESYVGWSFTGGHTLGAPSVTEATDSYVFLVRGLDNSVWGRELGSDHVWLSDWGSLGGTLVGTPVYWPTTYWQVGVRGVDNYLYFFYLYGDPPSWVQIPGQATSDPVASASGLLFRGLDGSIWLVPNAGGWQPLWGSSPSPPAITPLTIDA